MAKANLNRTFGVEMEFIAPVGIAPYGGRNGIAHAIAARLTAAGIPTVFEGYNHHTRGHWKIVTDASLQPSPGFVGLEIVSPILRGEEGLAVIREVCRVLSDVLGCKVNRSCGHHVHHDVREWTPSHFERLVYLVGDAFENVIDDGMAPSRRGNASQWCRSVRGWNAETVRATLAGYGAGRYHRVNLTNFATRGTVEFRQHAGTLNADKICSWVVLTSAMIETAAKMRRPALRNVGTWKAFRRMIYVVQRGRGDTPETDRAAALTYQALEFFEGRRKHFARRENRRVA